MYLHKFILKDGDYGVNVRDFFILFLKVSVQPHRRELKRKCNNLQKVLRTGYADAGWKALACLFVTLEECLEALGILPDTQAAKPKRRL